MTVENPKFLSPTRKEVYRIMRDICTSVCLGTYISALDQIVGDPLFRHALSEPLKTPFIVTLFAVVAITGIAGENLHLKLNNT